MADSTYEPRKKPVQARSRATYDAILEAAAQLLDEGGYGHATTNAIAERAGVSIGSVYEYFPSKDAIFAALKSQLDQETFEAILHQLGTVEDRDPANFLRAILEARVRSALARPRLETLLREEIPASVFADQQAATFAAFDAGMRSFVERHRESVRLEDIDAAMPLGVNVIELTVRHLAATDPERLRDPATLDALVDMMSRWILSDPA